MAEVQAAKFSCDGCGKSYKWKPEFAGKKVKCKCGFVMTAPAAPRQEPEDEPDLDALYSLADEGKQAAKAGAVETAIRCPSCKTTMEPGSSICSNCGFNLKTGGRTAAPKAAAATVPAKGPAGATGKQGGAAGAFAAFGPPKRGLQKDEPQDFKTVDLYLPIGVLVAGIALMVLQFMKFNSTNEPPVQALMYTGLWMGISFGLVAVSSIFLIRFMEMAFGDPALAALKIAAIVTGPAAAANIVSFLIHDVWGMVGLSIAFGLFFILYHYLFDFDMSEKWIIVGVTLVICMIVTPFLFSAAIGTNPMLASKGENNLDAEIDYLMDLGRPKEAFEWIGESTNRMVGDTTRPESEALFNGLRDAGATQIWVGPVGPQAAEVFVKMPKDAKKREAIVDFAKEWLTRNKGAAEKYTGGKWFLLRFLPYEHPEPIGF